MKAGLTLRAGQRGTKKLCKKYGDRLLYVRYRYDAVRKKRVTTVEIIVDEGDWTPSPSYRPDQVVAIRIEREERDLQRAVKQAGGWWHLNERAWTLRYDKVVELHLEDRIIHEER